LCRFCSSRWLFLFQSEIPVRVESNGYRGAMRPCRVIRDNDKSHQGQGRNTKRAWTLECGRLERAQRALQVGPTCLPLADFTATSGIKNNGAAIELSAYLTEPVCGPSAHRTHCMAGGVTSHPNASTAHLSFFLETTPHLLQRPLQETCTCDERR
jgi:hypothetical protein